MDGDEDFEVSSLLNSKPVKVLQCWGDVLLVASFVEELFCFELFVAASDVCHGDQQLGHCGNLA